MACDQRVGGLLNRAQGLAWLLFFAILGWCFAGVVQFRPDPPRLLVVSQARDGEVACYGREHVEVTVVSRLDTALDAGRMVLTVPEMDRLVVIPASARTVLVNRRGQVTVLAEPLPSAVIKALLGPETSLAERIGHSEAARAALRFVPRAEEFLRTP